MIVVTGEETAVVAATGASGIAGVLAAGFQACRSGLCCPLSSRSSRRHATLSSAPTRAALTTSIKMRTAIWSRTTLTLGIHEIRSVVPMQWCR
jgi:hypothetical protein